MTQLALPKQISVFFIVGGISTGVHVCAAWLCLWSLSVGAPTANIMGNLTALPLAYLGHSKFTFGASIGVRRFIVYAANNYLVFLLSILTAFALDYIDVDGYINIFVSALVFPVFSYLLHKLFTFKE